MLKNDAAVLSTNRSTRNFVEICKLNNENEKNFM